MYYPRTILMTSSRVEKGPGAMWQNAAFGDALMKIIEGHCSTMVTLDLSNNMIRAMQTLRRLGNVAKQLQNLNLSNNDWSE